MMDIEKNKKRKEIEKRINESNLKERIHIDKNELEYLLFDVVKDRNESEAKFLMWSGLFLSKIDLSEVDFDNVVWDIEYDIDGKRYYLDNGITEINLSKTNAKIDFTKSHNFEKLYHPTISGCNFFGTDLSKSFGVHGIFTSNGIYVNNCNFKRTKLGLDLFDRIKEAYSNNFSNNDFSKLRISKEFIINNPNNNFNNTGINIIDKENDKTDLYEELFERNNLINCYFNGYSIHFPKDINEINAGKLLRTREKHNKRIVELRKKYEKELSKLEPGERIHIDKNLLESLLFETKELYYRYNGEPDKIKFLVWSGPFLSKIDLSEISFDNVEWDIKYDEYNYRELKVLTKKQKDHNIGVYKLNNIHSIDLSNTNAKIDFNKSASFLREGRVIIRHCNFSSTNLSNNKLKNCYIDSSNLSNTGIKINDEICGQHYINTFKITITNLSNNDFSYFHPFRKTEFERYFGRCNFDNTGLNILVEENQTLDRVIGENSVKGCFINGLTYDEFEKNVMKNELLDELKEHEENLKYLEEADFREKENIKALDEAKASTKVKIKQIKARLISLSQN